MSGIFDFFKKKSRPHARGGEPERGLTLPQVSIFDVYRPQEEHRFPALRPEEAGPLSVQPPEPRRLPGFLRIFEAFTPTLPAIPEPASAPGPLTIWEEIFGPPATVEERPIAEMFPAQAYEAMLPAEMPPTAEAFGFPPEQKREPKYTFLRIPKLPSLTSEWRIPQPEELADHFQEHFMLDNIFKELEETRKTSEWGQMLLDQAMRGKPLAVPIDPVVHRNFYTDFAKLFNIPWDLIQEYIGQARTQEDLDSATQTLMDYVIGPHMDVLSEAFDILKPTEFPGWFSVDYDKGTNTWWLYYNEIMLTAIPYEGEQQVG